jgi:outer membrane protein
MRFRLIAGWLIVLTLMAAIGYAQQPVPAAPAAAPSAPLPTLSLAEAMDLARRNNPLYRQTLNDRWEATRNMRSATAQLLTPSLNVGAGRYTSGSGSQSFGGATIPVESSTRESWSLSFDYQLSGATFANRSLRAAQLRAIDEDIAGMTVTLETSLREQYLLLLRTIAQEEQARRNLERRTEELALATARQQVGQVTLIDVRQAQVARGQAEVGVLGATQNVINRTLELFQQIGVPAPPGARVQPTDSFPVVEPRWNVDDLIRQALTDNPALRALRVRQNAARWGVRAANAQYLPSLVVSGGYGQFRSCCRTVMEIDSSGAAPDTTFPRVRASGVNPWNVYVGLSLPLFDQFSRSATTAQARALENDLQLSIRSRELQLRAQVTAAFHTLDQAYRTIAIQESNRIASTEALELATQRYRVGSGNYIDLLSARVTAEEAAAAHISAIYDYHRAIAALENAVGRTLR